MNTATKIMHILFLSILVIALPQVTLIASNESNVPTFSKACNVLTLSKQEKDDLAQIFTDPTKADERNDIIAKKYRALALKLHPDKVRNALSKEEQDNLKIAENLPIEEKEYKRLKERIKTLTAKNNKSEEELKEEMELPEKFEQKGRIIRELKQQETAEVKEIKQRIDALLEKQKELENCKEFFKNGKVPKKASEDPGYAAKSKEEKAKADLEDAKSILDAKEFKHRLYIHQHGKNYIKKGFIYGLPIITIGYLIVKYQEYKKGMAALEKEVQEMTDKANKASWPQAKKTGYLTKVAEYKKVVQAKLKRCFIPGKFARACGWLGGVGLLYAVKQIYDANKEFGND